MRRTSDSMIEPLEVRRLLFAGQAETIFGVGGESAIPGFGPGDIIADTAADFSEFTDPDTGLGNTLLRFNDDKLVRMDIGGRLVTDFGNGGGLDLDVALGLDVELQDATFDGATGRIATLTVESGSQFIRLFDIDGNLIGDFDTDGRFAIPAGVTAFNLDFADNGVIGYSGIDASDTVVLGEVTQAGSATLTTTIITADGRLDYLEFQTDDTAFIGGTTFDGGIEHAFVYRLAPDRIPTVAGSFDSFVDLSVTGSRVLDLAQTIDGVRALIGIVSDEAIDSDVTSPGTSFEAVLVAEVFEDFMLPTGQFLQDMTDFVYAIGGELNFSGETTLVGLRDGEPVPFASTRYLANGEVDLTYGFNGFTEFEGRPIVMSDSGVVHVDETPADGGDALIGLIQTGIGRTGPSGGVTVDRSSSIAVVTGSADADAVRVSIRASDGRYVVRANGEIQSFPPPTAIFRVELGAGDDELLLAAGVGQVTANGDAGNDTLRGGDVRDVLEGDVGDDFLYGNGGEDQLRGGDGNDFLFGGDDDDELLGGDGNDSLNGNAQGDRLFGQAGNDTLNGAGGNDTLFGGLGESDDNRGGAGFDRAEDDVLDTYSSVEELLA